MNEILIDLDESVSKIIENVDLKSKIEKIVYFALEEERINANSVSISIKAVDKEEIRNINKEYRNIDSATDVLSFPIFTKEELEEISKSEENKRIPNI